jgi:hypothetical protein
MKGAMEKQTFSTPRRVMVREVAMRAKECGDLSLLLRCQRGDVEAFGDIY